MVLGNCANIRRSLRTTAGTFLVSRRGVRVGVDSSWPHFFSMNCATVACRHRDRKRSVLVKLFRISATSANEHSRWFQSVCLRGVRVVGKPPELDQLSMLWAPTNLSDRNPMGYYATYRPSHTVAAIPTKSWRKACNEADARLLKRRLRETDLDSSPTRP